MSLSVADFPRLVERCGSRPRDETAWTELVGAFDSHVSGLALHWTRALGSALQDRQEDALEIRMEVWVKLLREDGRAMLEFRGETEESFLAYLARIVRHQTLDLRRRRLAAKRPTVPVAPEILDGLRDHAPRPDEIAERNDLRTAAVSCLRHRWEGKVHASRNVLICLLGFFDGMSAARIAGIGSLGLSRGGVEKILAKGQEALRRKLDAGLYEQLGVEQ